MRHFIRVALATLFLSLSVAPAMAAQVQIGSNTYDISNAEAAKLQQAAAAATGPGATASNIEEYGKIGTEIGASLASTAKQLGVAVNQFAKTRVGMLTTVIIIYKLIGQDLIGYFFGSIWFMVMIPLWVFFLLRLRPRTITVTTPKDGPSVKRVDFGGWGDNAPFYVTMVFILVAIAGSGFIMMFSGS